MKFEDAQDIAYRLAQAVYFRKLKKLVGGEDYVLKLADSHSRHSALMIIGDKAIAVQVAIDCGKVFRVDSLEDAIKQSNKVTRT